MKIKQSMLSNTIIGGRPQNAATGGEISIYEPQTMLPAYRKRMPVTTFLRDRLFPGFQTFRTKQVLMDFYKNKQRIAPFVAEGSRPVNIRRDGYRTDSYTPPFINLSKPYDVDLLQTRGAGEVVFGGMSPAERALLLMQQDYTELDDMIVRREEAMIAELIQTGSLTITGYIDDAATQVRTDTINYGFTNIISLTGTDQWSNAASKKYDDLLEAVTLVRKAGYNPTAAILGEDAWKLLRQDSGFMNQYMDLRYAQFGAFNPQLNLQNGNGYAYIGRLTEIGIDLYQYLAWYFDETTQSLKPYIEPNKIVITADSIGEMLFGANTIIPEEGINFVTVEAPRVSKVVVDRTNDTKSLVVKSRPIPKPYDVDSWAVIEVTE